MNTNIEFIYQRYGPMVYRRCYKLLKQADAARDAMQEVFLMLTKRGKTLDTSSPSSLLYRMATNVCLNMIRLRNRRGLQIGEGQDDAVLAHIASAYDLERQVTVNNLLQRIFARQRDTTLTMAVLYWVDHMTLEEVAAEMEMSVSGVRKRLRELKASVKELEGVNEDD